MDVMQAYFDAVKNLDVHDATELTLRGDLGHLLTAIAREVSHEPRVLHEPKRDPTGLGAPDFKLKRHDEAIIGYVETKPCRASLEGESRSEQIAKYLQLSGNILLTNYWGFIRFRDGKIVQRETLCDQNDVGKHRARLDQQKAVKVKGLLANFCSMAPKGIATAKALALALAVRCQILRDFLSEALLRQEQEQEPGKVYGLYAEFKKNVFHELSLKEFADAFAQTLGYGLFHARLHATDNVPLTLHNAKSHIPGNFAVLRELMGFLDELDRADYHGIKWLVEEILSIMNTLDIIAVQANLAFTQGRDPFLYFYEDFLKVYDKETRRGRGVYYTPPPVVNFIVRAVHSLLKDLFAIDQGLAERRRVTVLDFATGTGTFLVEVIRQIFEATDEGIHAQIIQDHILKNIYGFEYLMAPYTIAHLKVSHYLQEKGYPLGVKERIPIYLTNTLEPITPQANLLLPALSREVKAAQKIKEKPILVIIGNPPYSGHSKNNGQWITTLIDDYKRVDGQPLGEKNSKWLQDDYVKFIRFAQAKMQGVPEGIVAIITNHAFLDNPTFRGMRQSLMHTFNRIYALNLHGNTKRQEKTPEGGKDENVFDIVQGVAITMLIKKEGLSRAVYYADLWGSREGKYRALLSADRETIRWQELTPSPSSYLFVPQNAALHEEYERGWKVTDIFKMYVSGFLTSRDQFAVAFDEQSMSRRVMALVDDTVSDDLLYEKYHLKDTGDWKLANARAQLRGHRAEEWEKKILRCAYRPFDTRWCFLGYEVMDRPRKVLLGHVALKKKKEDDIPKNVCLIISRQTSTGRSQHSFVAEHPPEFCLLSDKTKEGNYAFPLFSYLTDKEVTARARKAKEAKTRPALQFIYDDSPTLRNKRDPNFSDAFQKSIHDQYGKDQDAKPIRATAILGYIYAVLYCPSYRERYGECLTRDFPFIPFVSDRKRFERLSKLGFDLMTAHMCYDNVMMLKPLMPDIPKVSRLMPDIPKVRISKGGHKIDKPRYDEQHNRVYINEAEYFSPVSLEAWDFRIGSYKVLHKYLHSREGRTLSLPEIETIEQIVQVVHFTIRQMQRIEAEWPPWHEMAQKSPPVGQMPLL